MKKICVVVTLVMCCAALLSVRSVAALEKDEQGLEKVRMVMSWLPYADYAVYTIGVKKGFYAEEGMAVELIPAKGSGLSTKLVAAGDAEFGAASADAALIARTKGMPLKFLATLHQTSPTSIFSLSSVGIKEPKDLEGKSLASDPESLKHKQFIAFCKLNGVDMDKVTIIPIKGSSFVHILEGKVDAMLAFGYIGDALLRAKGHEVNEIKLNDYGVDIYSIGLITTDAMISENAAVVKRFVSATLKSWNYAVAHPEEALDSYCEMYPELTKEDEAKQVTGVIELMQSDSTKANGLGYQAKEKWEATQDFLLTQGLIESTITIDDMFTNEFLPKE